MTDMLKMSDARFLARVVALVFFLCMGMFAMKCVYAGKPSVRAKFYDFSEQLIDGEVKRPTALYTDSRQQAKFKRLLRLKRSFMKDMFDTARLPVFK